MNITPAERIAVTQRLGDFKTSMLADLEAGRALELAPQLGAVAEIARTARCSGALHAFDSRFDAADQPLTGGLVYNEALPLGDRMVQKFKCLAFAALGAAAICAQAAAAAQSAAAATPAAVAGFSYVKSQGGIDEYRLDANGLDGAAAARPLGAGGDVDGDLSRRLAQRGRTGTTGATHLLEHLMFKGTRELNEGRQGQRVKLLERDRRPSQRHDLARPHQLFRDRRVAGSGAGDVARSRSHAESCGCAKTTVGRR